MADSPHDLLPTTWCTIYLTYGFLLFPLAAQRIGRIACARRAGSVANRPAAARKYLLLNLLDVNGFWRHQHKWRTHPTIPPPGRRMGS